MQDIRNKVVVITGSSQGIGLQTALKFGREGARLVLNGRNEEKLLKASNYFIEEELDVLTVCADVSTDIGRKLLISETIRHYGQLDVLINNASLFMKFSISESTDEALQKILDTNFAAPIMLTREALPYLTKQKGCVIMISSIASFMGVPRHSAYSAAKMGLTAFSQALRIELKPEEVHVGIVYLGFIKNDPAKTELDGNGNGIKMSSRPTWLQTKQETAANMIYKMVINRQIRKKMGIIGIVTEPFILFFPGLTDFFLTRAFKKNI